MDCSYQEIAKMIDHSLLTPSLTVDQLEAGCRLAVNLDVASVCIMPYYLKRCAEFLNSTTVKPSTTVGFPHGANATAVKLAEAARAVADGGKELDMVVNVSKVLSGDWKYVRDDIDGVRDIAHSTGARLKVIFENCYLTDEQKIVLCEICGELNVDWVKTSTGYGTSGATVADVQLMRQHSPSEVQVKAAGGIRDLDTLLHMRKLGATRIGATRSEELLDECQRRLQAES